MQILTGKYIELANAFVHNIFQRNVCVVLYRSVEHIAVTEVTVIIETIEIECMSKDFFFCNESHQNRLASAGHISSKKCDHANHHQDLSDKKLGFDLHGLTHLRTAVPPHQEEPLRGLRHVVRRPPGPVPEEVFQAYQPGGGPGTHSVSRLTLELELLQVTPDELVEVEGGGGRQFGFHSHRHCCYRLHPDKKEKMMHEVKAAQGCVCVSAVVIHANWRQFQDAIKVEQIARHRGKGQDQSNCWLST